MARLGAHLPGAFVAPLQRNSFRMPKRIHMRAPLSHCGLWLVACALWLVACSLWLVACGLLLVAIVLDSHYAYAYFLTYLLTSPAAKTMLLYQVGALKKQEASGEWGAASG